MNLLAIRILAGVLVLSALAAMYHWHAESLREEGRAEVRAEWAIARNAQQAAALAEAAQNAEETKRRLAAQQEAQHAHETRLAAARRDAATARAAADGLRRDLATFAAAARGAASNPAAPAGSPATRVELLADVLGDVEQAGRRMAEAADLARAAGQLCAESYDSLTKR